MLVAHFPRLSTDVRSPAFLWPETVQAGFADGTACPTNEKTFHYFVRQIAKKHAWATVHTPSFKSKDGHGFKYLVLSTSNTGIGTKDPTKLRIWLQSGVHGNEPAGDQALLVLLGKLDSNPVWASSVLGKADIVVFPRYNVDGIAAFVRCGGGRLDPNRDQIRLAVPQAKGVRKLFCEFAPHIGDCWSRVSRLSKDDTV